MGWTVGPPDGNHLRAVPPRRVLRLEGIRAVHPDGTVGVSGVDLTLRVVSGTIAENVDRDHDRDVVAALRAAQMDDGVQAAGGVTTLVGHRGLRLSGGQTQRLALARALSAEADLVLFDDVFSARDAAMEADLWDTLTARDATIIAATSRVVTLARADRVVVLEGGGQVEAGHWLVLSTTDEK